MFQKTLSDTSSHSAALLALLFVSSLLSLSLSPPFFFLSIGFYLALFLRLAPGWGPPSVCGPAPCNSRSRCFLRQDISFCFC